MSKDAFCGGSLLADDELVDSLHVIEAFSLEELVALIEKLAGGLFEELEFACIALELGEFSLDEDCAALDEICSLEENVSLDDEF